MFNRKDDMVHDDVDKILKREERSSSIKLDSMQNEIRIIHLRKTLKELIRVNIPMLQILQLVISVVTLVAVIFLIRT